MIWPGASEAGPKTTEFVGVSLLTTTLVSVMLPALLTLPEYSKIPPGGTALGGQYLATRIAGEVVEAHEALAVTVMLLHALLPVAVSVSVHGPQALAGVV